MKAVDESGDEGHVADIANKSAMKLKDSSG